MALGKGLDCVGCDGPFFFFDLVFLFYYLPWRRKRVKERNGEGLFLLDKKKRENI